jgi:pimeloyl-ACP methyl ester carboxylesterase
MESIKYVRENGTEIAYDDFGEGKNVLLLVHGHPFNRTMWRPPSDRGRKSPNMFIG